MKKSVAIAAFVLAVALAGGQSWQFSSDANGNLLTQTSATISPPQIQTQPQPQVVAPGALASFFVVAADTSQLTYQWRFNGTNISGATNDALLLQNVGATNEGHYSVVLTKSSINVTSAPAALMLDADGDGLPDSWELASFGNLTNTATGDFDGDGVSNIDELLDGTNPADKSSARFRLIILSDGGSVEAVPARQSYTNGETVTLTAVPIPPNVFHGWTGDTNSLGNPITLTMTNNQTLFAHLGPLDFVWTNSASGDWSVASNWDPNFVPGANDTVSISKGGVTVTISSNTQCRNLALASSSLTVSSGSSLALNILNLNSGTLSGSGVIIVSTLNLNSGTLGGSGVMIVSNQMNWTGGTMSGSGRTLILPGAILNVPGAVTLNNRTLENGGTILWTGGNFAVSAAIITNRAGALFEARTATGLNYIASPGSRFDNAGTFRKALNAGTTAVFAGMSFNNYNIVEIQTGTLSLSGGGTHTGTFDVAAGTTLNLSGGTHTASGGSSLAGAGNITVSGGAAATLAGLVNVSGTNTFDGGTANLTGNYICTNNTLVMSGGTANFNGSGTVTPAVLNQDSGTLSGSQVVTVLSQMNWTGGTLSGSGRTLIPPGATLNIASVAATVSLTGGRTLENGGTILWTAGNFALSSAVITNRPGALFEVRSAFGLNYTANPGSRFDNAGTFRKALNAGTTAVFAGMSFNNYNIVEIQTGTLSLSGGGAHTGTFDVSAGTTLHLSGGTHTASGESSLAGAGNFTVSGGAAATLAGLVNVSGTNLFDGGTANLTGNYICTNNTLVMSGGTANFNGTGIVTPAVVNMDSGTLGGNQVVTVLRVMNWTGGTMSGSGRTIIPVGVTLNLANAGGVSLTTRTLENGGTVLWTGAGNITLNGAVITNRAGALFEIRGVGGLAFSAGIPRFDNAGTFRKAVNPGTTTVFSGVVFNNYNTVEIQTGILAANGGFASTANSLLNCALGGTTPGTGYGRLQVAGTVTLNGALGVSLANGFLPALNDSFAVLTAGTRNGTFTNFYYPSNEVTMQMSNSANSVIVRVSEVLVVPRPILLQPEFSGADIRLIWTAVSNSTYRLEYETGSGFTNWTGLPGDVTSLSNTASILDALTSSNRFYRVRVLP